MPGSNIHGFNGSTFDADGEVLFGFYYEFLNEFNLPTGTMMGPYGTALEAEQACQRALDTNDI